MRFWDTSAIVPLLTMDVQYKELTALYRDDPDMCVWWAAPIECVSAISRMERDQTLAKSSTQSALARLKELMAHWDEIEPSETIRELAWRLLRVHNLTAADACQLSAALSASENRPSTLQFVCLDKKLSSAAEREGFHITLW